MSNNMDHYHCRTYRNEHCEVAGVPGVSCQLVECKHKCGVKLHLCQVRKHYLDCIAKDEESAHEHCNKCYLMKCMEKLSPQCCERMSCSNECGLIFHKCKAADHEEICLKAIVQCTNHTNGCPVELSRHKINEHLNVCPASVIYCTMEWNRWPIHCSERKSRVPFVQGNLHAKYGQLDVALALRDQRMLNSALKAPRSTRRAMRNKLTKYFPAVPLHNQSTSSNGISNNPKSNDTSHTISDDDSDVIERTPPALSRSLCSDLYRSAKQTTESLSEAINLAVNSTPSKQKKQTEEFNDSGFSIEQPGAILSDTSAMNESDVCDISNIESADANDSVSSLNDCSYKTDERNLASTPIMNKSAGDNSVIPTPPIAPITLHQMLALDLNVESVTRYQVKPKAMYTFLCAQEFRRDEYPWHFRNVHNDIHSCLNGWLEQRCPLAHYGCTYSIRRFYPNEKGSTVVHSSATESFGLKPKIPEEHKIKRYQHSFDESDRSLEEISESPNVIPKKTKTPEMLTSTSYDAEIHLNGGLSSAESSREGTPSRPRLDILTSLPFEIIQAIARHLDSFSLRNLALVSNLMRDVCLSLVEERGIVIQQWEKQSPGTQPVWQITYKSWKFSSAFSPIHKWGFQEHNSLSNHLKQCPFNIKEINTEPYSYSFGMEQNPPLKQDGLLDNSSKDQDNSSQDN
ncbi:unnamed protein product [Owenia fusiformis]|uniref:Uncharacterized protein n=1 Tax=Owenia fusiformis TaxID=6347 RepID=A0A8J1TYE9_OWEFU|nr:unnamed protein product [Owenia fusiformis]